MGVRRALWPTFSGVSFLLPVQATRATSCTNQAIAAAVTGQSEAQQDEFASFDANAAAQLLQGLTPTKNPECGAFRLGRAVYGKGRTIKRSNLLIEMDMVHQGPNLNTEDCYNHGGLALEAPM